MILELSNWTAFKDLCIVVKNLNNQFTEDSVGYDLYGPDANELTWHTRISKSNPANSDQTDFETNYKAQIFNFAIGTRLYPFTSSDMQFSGQGFVFTFPKGSVGTPLITDRFFQLANGFYINGGEYWGIGATAGDTVQIDVVDHDNLLGYGADFVLVSPPYMQQWNVLAQDNIKSVIQTPYAAKPPAGMYFRVRYTANGTSNDVLFYCNLYMHKGI